MDGLWGGSVLLRQGRPAAGGGCDLVGQDQGLDSLAKDAVNNGFVGRT